MGYLMLWIESLAVALLLVSAGVAWAARYESRWKRWLMAVSWALIPICLGMLGLAVNNLLDVSLIRNWYFSTLAWTVVVALAVIFIVWIGLRWRGEPAAPRARGWERGKLVVAGLVALALWMATFWNMDTAAKLQLAAVRAEAGAMALSAAPSRIPDQDNAALLYQEAFEALVPRDKLLPEWQLKSERWLASSWVPNRSGPVVSIDWNDPALVSYLARQADGLELVREASARPNSFFDRDYRSDMVLPELDKLQYSVQLLSLEARYKATRGETRAAISDVAAILNTARHTAGEPIFVDFLAGASMMNIGRDTLEFVLTNTTPTREDLLPLREVKPFFFRPALRRSLQMEQAMGLSLFVGVADLDYQAARRVGDPDLSALSLGAPLWRVFLLPEDLGDYRDLMQRWLTQLGQPYPDSQVSLMQLDFPHSSPLGMLTHMTVPRVSQATSSAGRADASRRLVLLAAAVAEYRAAEEKFPARLEDLVPKYIQRIPADPFSGHPLRMLLKENYLVLYSIGPDGKDDEGKRFDPSTRLGDIVLTIGKGPAELIPAAPTPTTP